MVTDKFHEARSMAIASSVGLTPHPTPTQTSPINGISAVPYYAKETVGVALGRIIGFDHLDSIHSFGSSRPSGVAGRRPASVRAEDQGGQFGDGVEQVGVGCVGQLGSAVWAPVSTPATIEAPERVPAIRSRGGVADHRHLGDVVDAQAQHGGEDHVGPRPAPAGVGRGQGQVDPARPSRGRR